MRQIVRITVAALAVCCCLVLALYAGRIGLSKERSKEALKTLSLATAERSVLLSPSDADAHYSLAVALTFNGRVGEGLSEFEKATALRPQDYFLWLAVGAARDEAGDANGALAAFREAVRLAPSYAQPRWQLGNVLLRAGNTDEAFQEMRRAAKSNPQLLPAFIDLVWAASGGDAESVRRIVQPETSSEHLALARLFVRKGKTEDALVHFRLAGKASEQERASLLQELMAGKHYKEAYEVWRSGANNDAAPASGLEAIIDGGFEKGINLDETAFGWRIPRSLEGVQASLDRSMPKEGAQSLLLEWKGNGNPAYQVVSQLVQVEPNRRYQLNFSARTSDLVTGGGPVIAINDAASGAKLAESTSLVKNGNGWADYSVEFTTGAEASAVIISLLRQNCSSSPCPMFGKVWLDAFSLKRV